MTTATSVHIFDFDGTIFRSPEKPEDWQGGWWSKSESLYPPFVPESPDASWYNPKVVSAIRNANSDPDAYTVLMTGRLPKLGDRVKELCRKHGITFDEWQFNKGGSTEEFKMRQMRKLVEEHGFKHVTLWEDRHVEIYRPFLDSFVENKVHEVVGFVADKPPSKNADSPDHEKQIALMKFLSGVAKKLDVSEHVYVVGGAVRDFVLGYPIKDLDIVIDPTETGKDSAWFAEQLDRHIPVNTSYATNNYGVAIITVRGDWMLDGHNLSGEVIEIANTRKETYGGSSGKGYKPSEVTSADIVEDTLRREFTFNTMLMRLSELADGPDKDAIIDLTGCGLSDLKNGILQCPSDPDKTFSDDPTRMIRVIKFLLRYDMKPTQDTITSIKANAKKLRNVPYEALAKLLVHDCFKEPTYAKALDYMEKYGLLSVIKDIMEKNDNFRTYMLRWSNTKPVSMMLDLMDIGLPLQANVGFLTVDQISTLREVTLGMTREDSIGFLSGLRQPSSVWKDKAFFGTLLTELEVPTSDVPEFSKKVNAVARDILLENPSILLNPSTLRGSIIARLKTPNVRMGSTDWNPKKVNLISVILDDSDAPLAWFRKNITKTLPETYSHHITLWYKPPINVSEASKEKFGQEVKIRVIGYVNEPDVQAFEVSISPSGLPIAPNKFLHLTLATDHKPPSIADTMRDRVIPIDGPVFTGKIGFKMGASYFVGAGKTASTLLPVSSPVHNLREIVKQMILLEDHLFQTSKQCSDCIDKHLLSIEALAEEMVTLADSDSPYQSHGEKIAEFSRLISHFIDTSNSQGKSSYKFAASAIRSVRKSLSSHLRTVKSLLPITAEKVATKTKAEKEDASAESLVKRSPKLKPPRKESRKERVDNVDPDIAAFKEEKYRSTSKNHKYT